MKSTATIFLAAFAAASFSWAGFVLAPQIQLGQLTQAKPTGSDNLYPAARPGLAAQGAEVYRSLGCVYCHSQQVRQESSHVDVMLNEIGTNAAKVAAIVSELNHPLRAAAGVQIGKITEVADVPAGEPLVARLRDAGAKADLKVVATGSDISRGWGIRQSVAQDYLFDHPVQLGTRRSGPDLSNAGSKPAEWHLLHLYNPTIVENSTMPPYPFLFETRKKTGNGSPDALKVKTADGYEVVPTEAARALVAYLRSLRVDAPLYEAPVTVAQVVAPTSTNNAATNTPAK